MLLLVGCLILNDLTLDYTDSRPDIGHMELLKRGILHRDVSLRNILKGRPGAGPGDRGILIDLDLAIHYVTNGANPLTDCRIVSATPSSQPRHSNRV
jgi:hypothetical protein